MASEILPGWLVDTHRLHVFPLLWFARVTRGSVVQRHVFGVTQRQAFRRGCRWLLVNHCSCRDAGPEETPAEWRVGEHYKIDVYEGERPVATFHTIQDAHGSWRLIVSDPSPVDSEHRAHAAIERVRAICGEEIPKGRPYGVFAKRVLAALADDCESCRDAYADEADCIHALMRTELARTEGDLAVAVHEATQARAMLSKVRALQPALTSAMRELAANVNANLGEHEVAASAHKLMRDLDVAAGGSS